MDFCSQCHKVCETYPKDLSVFVADDLAAKDVPL
jgi:hypothetical protein